MTQTIRVPDPVYDRLVKEAQEKDVPVGTVVRDWRDDSDKLARLRDRGEINE